MLLTSKFLLWSKILVNRISMKNKSKTYRYERRCWNCNHTNEFLIPKGRYAETETENDPCSECEMSPREVRRARQLEMQRDRSPYGGGIL